MKGKLVAVSFNVVLCIFACIVQSSYALRLSWRGMSDSWRLWRQQNAPSETFRKVISHQSKTISSTRTFLKTVALGATIFQLTSKKALAQGGEVCIADLEEESVKTDLGVPFGNEDVRKRPSDDRVYRALQLPNGMRTLLISDPASNRAAAAIDVHVGSFSDPLEVPGLAHFCEHMSFLGTTKYPKEEEFSSFLASHGGASNAYTDSEDTVYYFDVNAEFVEEALDRFSQFFIAPLFTQSATDRELNAIDSEHAKNINNDGFRLYQLEKDGANPLHPLCRFSTGDKSTLETEPKKKGIDVRSLLLDFHKTRYSANVMTLCIIGRQDLDTLEKWVHKYFTPVPNKNAPDPALEWWGKVKPFIPQKAANVLEVVPVGELRRLSISWPVSIPSPERRDKLVITKPEQVVSHLIGHEGKGSIRSLLAEKGWGNSVQAAVSNDVSDLQMFEVSADLTEEGFKHRYEVIDMIFAYIHMLNDPSYSAGSRKSGSGVPDYVYKEVMQLSSIGFNYSEKSDPTSYVSDLAAEMQEFRNPRDYLTGIRLFEHPDDCEVQRYLAYLVPEEARIKVISPEFKGKTSKQAKWYGTNFNNITLASETKKWSQTLASGGKWKEQLALPAPNPFIPERFDLLGGAPIKSEKQRLKELNEAPVKIREDAHWTVWHKLDRVFSQPKVYAVFKLSVPEEKFNADFVVESKLFVNCFLDSLNEYLYDARLAGLSFDLEFTSRGVQIILSGFNDKMPLFAKEVFEALKNYKPDAATFDRYKDLLVREFLSWRTQQPYYHCAYFASLASETLNYKIDELQASLKEITPECIGSFLKSTTESSYGTAMVIGNIDAKGTEQLVSIVEDTFKFEPLAESARSRRRALLVPLSPQAVDKSTETEAEAKKAAGYRIARAEPNEQDDNSAVAFYFQMPSRKVEDYILVELLAEALEQAFYNSLRTQQQLGYIVYSGVKNREGIYNLAMVAQSAIVSGAELSRRVEAFIESWVADLIEDPDEHLSQEDFEAFQDGIAVRKLEPDQRLTSQAGRLWAEIVNTDVEAPQFDRHEHEVKALRAVTRKQFIQFIKDFLSPDGSKRRLLVSQITSQDRLKETEKEVGKVYAEADAQTDADHRRLLSVPVDLIDVKDESEFMKTLERL